MAQDGSALGDPLSLFSGDSEGDKICAFSRNHVLLENNFKLAGWFRIRYVPDDPALANTSERFWDEYHVDSNKSLKIFPDYYRILSVTFDADGEGGVIGLSNLKLGYTEPACAQKSEKAVAIKIKANKKGRVEVKYREK